LKIYEYLTLLGCRRITQFQGLPTNLKPKIEKHAYQADTLELKALPTLSAYTATPARDIEYYPASLCVLIVWLVFVLLLLWLLESAETP
jgi:hypothetical protein